MTEAAAPRHAQHRLPRGSTLHRLSTLAPLLLLVLFGFGNTAFLTVNNGLTGLVQTSIIGLLAIGMTLVIIIRGIDPSAGSVLVPSGAAPIRHLGKIFRTRGTGLVLIFHDMHDVTQGNVLSLIGKGALPAGWSLRGRVQ